MINTKNILFGLLLTTVLLLTGCGQKGDLYLPGQEKASLGKIEIDHIV
ncbi:MAG: lipoprotein [Gammaproteobacteria bacterium]